jgi:hypothetical protein
MTSVFLPRRWFERISKYNHGIVKLLVIDKEECTVIIETMNLITIELTYDEDRH